MAASRRSQMKTVIVSSTNENSRVADERVVNGSFLQEDIFEKRPKTDYTYSRSATYSSKYVDGAVISPNLSRRRLYTTEEMIREHMASSALKKNVSSQSHVRVYGSTRSTRSKNTLAANQTNSNVMEDNLKSTNNGINTSNVSYNNNVSSSRRNEVVTQHTLYTNRGASTAASSTAAAATSTAQSLTMQQNNNNASKSAFSDDESEEVMVRSTSNRKSSRRRTSSRSRSPRRNTKGASLAGSSKRRSTRAYGDEVDSDSVLTEFAGSKAGSKKGSTYAISSGLDSESELVTERSSTVIDTVATGTPVTAKLVGCVLFIYGCTRILLHRMWHNFGLPIYATLQRYLLLDTWILSRRFISTLRSLILALLLLLIPLVLLSGSACGLHYMGWLNISPCAKVTGVYYVSKRSDINTPGMSDKIRTMLNGWFMWNEGHQPPVPPPVGGAPSVDWEAIIDARVTALRSSLELKSNTEISVQRQRNTDLETALKALTRDVEEVKMKLSSLSDITAELTNLKARLAHISDLTDTKADRQSITKLQNDLKKLQLKLGEVEVDDANAEEYGVLTYLQTEIHNLRKVVEKQKEVVVPDVCPGSACVCENELGLRLRALHDQLLNELNEKGGTTVYVTPDNSTGISEQFVKQLIQDELDIFSADKTGMPDFALQSMGAQVLSTRCSQTYYQDTGLMTYFGFPLYHLHKDPSIVIQPGVTPGECWCFHGQSGYMCSSRLEVYGLRSELDTEGRRIGGWRYENTGPRLQFFPVQDTNIPGFPIVELRILNNWGKKEFTCLYRFRVHGKLAPK
ncbi:sun1 [Bugula neritina]|uniref:Sun1 n=1 Tax=Bugula neritina TaxID=10212 RepID=A0A7J7IYH0_BUGNE|nr:sun1 [Bugula neritina]